MSLTDAVEDPDRDATAVATGYDRDFLGARIDAPGLGAALVDDVAHAVDGAAVLDYTHFSLQMCASRRFAFWVAWNIDGATLTTITRSGLDFRTDPRLDERFQVGDEVYDDNLIDRGHIARRVDLVWGPEPVAEKANRDSFYFTNIAPQTEDFNRSSRKGLWGRLENAVFEEAEVDDLRVTAFGGPVFRPDDRVYRDIALPREFWKVLAYRDHGELTARAFVLTQNLDQLGLLALDEFRVYQVSLGAISDRTGLVFPDALHEADTKAVTESPEGRRPLALMADIQW